MSHTYSISQYCKIKSHKAQGFDFNIICEDNTKDFQNLMRYFYSESAIDYAKFFKMDALSKLGFITAELLLKNFNLSQYKSEEIGVVISNSYATLDTDTNFYTTINDKENYFPSPAVFVYTLPNIMIGEICIRHNIKGENAFFVSKEFDQEFIINYVLGLFKTTDMKCCITGWVDLYKEDYQSILYLVEKKEGAPTEFNVENVKKLYLE